MAKGPLNGKTMERVRVEEFENQRYTIMDELILFFSRVFFLKILSRSFLNFMGVRVFIIGYVRNMKSHFSTKQKVLATHSRLGQVASFSREITNWPDCPFCPVVL